MRYKTIQSMLLPDSIFENHHLYFTGSDKARLLPDHKGLLIPEHETVDFFTYFNGFFKKQWNEYTVIKDVRVILTVRGNCRISFCHHTEEEMITDYILEHRENSREHTYTLSIPQWNEPEAQICHLLAEGRTGGGIVEDFRIEAAVPGENPVRAAVVICTYRREKAVKENLKRIGTLPKALRPTVFLVDNGNTLGEEPFPPYVRYVPNKNCGGTGGFTRGIIEVLEEASQDFTHVVLMDDDIRLEPGVLAKTWNFLSCLKEDVQTASLAGSILRLDIPWEQYECGAMWNRGKIIAGRHQLDLRTREALFENMKTEPSDYGGWWFCCFPVKQIREKGLPLPLFIHRDDIEYGMRMGKVISLNGIGVWHEAFQCKLPQTGEYYDIRNMAIVNSIYYDDWSAGEWKWFLRKWVTGNILRGRYEYIRLNLMGAMDFLRGVSWLRDTDAVVLHRKAGSCLSPLKPYDRLSEKEKKNYFPASPGLSVYTAAFRRRIRYQDAGGASLMTKKSLIMALRSYALLFRTERFINKNFERARRSYQTGYQELTTLSFWKKYLEIKEE